MSEQVQGVMNDTKWREIRTAMLQLETPPRWRTLALNGYLSKPDREWFYHFAEGGYTDIRHLDILLDSPADRGFILKALRDIGLPGEATDFGFRIYGYVEIGAVVDYL